MRKIFLLIIITAGIYISSFSQSVGIIFGNVSACKLDTISVPVMVKDFKNICAIGVRVNYDTTMLKYIKCIHINKEIPGADFARVKNFVTLGWFSSNSNIVANLKDDDKLFDIKFLCLKNPPINLNFVESGCVASDCNLKELPVVRKPGKVDLLKKCK